MTDFKLPDLDEYRAAAERLRDVVVHTPLVPLHSYEGRSRILLKPEIHQAVGSFKIRGVFNAVASLPEEERRQGLSTVSAGNTAQALCWAARYFGVPARSVMPETAPQSKIDAVKRYGGTPVLVPMDEVFRFLRERLWENEPYAFIHPWTNRDVMVGHGSLALEIVQDCADVKTVYVPVGGGGLIGGVGGAMRVLKPDVRIVAVEPEGCASLHASLEAGRPVTVPCETICDGVAVPFVAEEMFPLLRELVDDIVLVSEDAVRSTMRRLVLRNKIVSEPSGALATAAALQTSPNGPTVCLVTGGSIDAAKLVSILKTPGSSTANE